MNTKLKILCVTNKNVVKEPFLARIENILQGNIHALILREKDICAQDFYKLAIEVHEVCSRYKTPLFLNAKFADFFQHTLPLAHKLACGLHTSFENYTLALENNIFKNFSSSLTLGISIHSLQEAGFIKNNFSTLPVTHVIVGHIFETNCKQGTVGRGLNFLQNITEYFADIPQISVFAIGGLTPKRTVEVLKRGAHGVAVMSSFMESDNPLQLIMDFEKSV